MKRILNSYIIKEIAFPFFMSLLILTFILLIGKILQLMDLMINKGVDFSSIVKLILYLMPSFLTFTIPISLLISVLMAFGRLSGDSEIVVMKASGVSLYQLIQPVLFVAVTAAFVTSVFSLIVAPISNHSTKNLLFSIIQQKASAGIKEKVFNDDFSGLVIYAERIPASGESMDSVLIYDTRLTDDPSTIVAREGRLYSNPNAMSVTLRLANGSIHTVDPAKSNYRKTDFSTYDIQLDLASISAKPVEKSKTELKVRELIKKKSKLEDSKEYRELTVELHKKFTVPLACIIFGVLGVPLGITSRRSGKSRGFTLGIAIVLSYYVLQLGGDALGETGRIPPALGVWAPNMIFFVLTVIVFIISAREVHMGIMDRIGKKR